MGYTHYWSHGPIDPNDWKNLARDVRSILHESGDIPLAGWDGSGKPQTMGKRIALNGRRPDDYESFVLTPDATGFDFCKTGRMPYGAIVCAILLRASVVIPGFSVRSDGKWGDEWTIPRTLYASVFGAEVDQPEGMRP